MKTTPPDFFTKEISQIYDERNRRLSPITDNMHFLIRLMLRELPENARILCVGVGTGAEILSLAEAYPKWTFKGVDPAAPMLEVCRERLLAAGVLDRCELVNGYVHDVPAAEKFDATVCVLVGHFVKRDDRLSFYKAMTDRLKPGGHLINTEISYDLNSSNFPAMLKNWEAVHTLMGATPEAIVDLPRQLKEVLTVLSPEETERMLAESGLLSPVQFFRSFMIGGWCGKKT